MKRSEKIALGICGIFLIPTIGLSSAIGIYSAVNSEGNRPSLASVSNSSSQSIEEPSKENQQEETSEDLSNTSSQRSKQEMQENSPKDAPSSSSNSMTEENQDKKEVSLEEDIGQSPGSPDSNHDFPSLAETPIIQANTREKVMEIEENAKEEAKYASDDSIRMAVNYIRYDSQNFFKNNKVMEEALYYGYYLQYACQSDPEKEIFSDLGKGACLSIAYVYRGVDNENSTFTQTNLDKVKATLEMIDNPESLNTNKNTSRSSRPSSSLSSSRTPSS